MLSQGFLCHSHAIFCFIKLHIDQINGAGPLGLQGRPGASSRALNEFPVGPADAPIQHQRQDQHGAGEKGISVTEAWPQSVQRENLVENLKISQILREKLEKGICRLVFILFYTVYHTVYHTHLKMIWPCLLNGDLTLTDDLHRGYTDPDIWDKEPCLELFQTKQIPAALQVLHRAVETWISTWLSIFIILSVRLDDSLIPAYSP